MAKYNGRSYLENSMQKLMVNYLTGAETKLWVNWGAKNISVSYNKLYYILEGTFHFEIDGKSYEGKPGQMYFLPCNSVTSYNASDDETARKMWIHFTMNCGERDLFEMVQIQPYIVVDNPPYVQELFRSIFRYGKNGSVSNIMEVKAAILKLVSYYLETSEISFPNLLLDERFETVVRYIDDHLSEEIRLKDLAALMFLNSNYFIKFFKRNAGMSPVEYILKTRVNAAKVMLQSKGIPVKDVAIKCGFNTVYYFDRVFKRYTGLTPSAYRRIALATPGKLLTGESSHQNKRSKSGDAATKTKKKPGRKPKAQK